MNGAELIQDSRKSADLVAMVLQATFIAEQLEDSVFAKGAEIGWIRCGAERGGLEESRQAPDTMRADTERVMVR